MMAIGPIATPTAAPLSTNTQSSPAGQVRADFSQSAVEVESQAPEQFNNGETQVAALEETTSDSDAGTGGNINQGRGSIIDIVV